ncbi:MAG: PEGA domain-containing protein [Fidelibacterota bacterium]
MKPIFLLFCVGLLWSQIPVTVESVPPGANVIIDGSAVGNTPLKDYQMNTGEYTFELSLEGWAPAKKQIEIQSARSGVVNFRLRPLLKVLFNTKEKGLTFSLDEKYIWSKKRIQLYVEKGQHLLQVRKGDELVDEKILVFKRNQELNYSLKQLKSND